MAPSRAFGFSSSSASSRHANKARPTSDDEDHSEADDSYRRMKKSSTTTMSASAAGKSSSAASRFKRPHETAAADYDSRSVKKSTSTSSSHRPRTQHDDSGAEEDGDVPGLSDELLMERRAYDEWVDKKLSKLSSKREQLLEERLERIRSERDEIQSQYDELRQLRDTAPEQALEEFKKTAEARYRHDKDLINSLKAKIEAAEKRVKEAEGGGVGADRSMSILNASIRESVQPAFDEGKLEELKDAHRREMLEAERKQRRLEEDVKSYKLQLEQEIAQSKSLRSKSNANAEPSSAASTSLAAFEDERAVRKLYEDLTGLVVTGVEKIDANEPFRRFKAIFAQEDYYSVLMDLEESSSKLSTGKNGTRADIVYVPKIDDDRDGELLNSQMVPQEWLDALRFDRNMLFKWYEKTRKALMTDKARLKLRAREERSGRH